MPLGNPKQHGLGVPALQPFNRNTPALQTTAHAQCLGANPLHQIPLLKHTVFTIHFRVHLRLRKHLKTAIIPTLQQEPNTILHNDLKVKVDESFPSIAAVAGVLPGRPCENYPLAAQE
jgi:hypothetical protein